MKPEETFSCMVSAYYGVREMDEYKTKEFMLQEIQERIQDFVALHPLNCDMKKVAETIDAKTPLKTKLQDALIILPKLNNSLELILLIKRRLEQMKEEE